MFSTAVDIANRALQHCGVPRINATLGFAENSQRADETSFVYGKLKQAELRRNVWRFATRRTCIRPIDTNTMLLAPTLWESGATYFKGSIVSDETGFLWQSKVANNLGNQPQNSNTWEPYFGPLTVSLYDYTQSYFTGELVYTAPGDGSYNVYVSLMTGNQVDPSLPNQWSATTVYGQNNVVQAFPAWAGGTTYSQGQTVVGPDLNIYSSLTNSNLGSTPASSPTAWAPMPVLTLASQQVPETTYNEPPQSSPIIEWESGTTYSLSNFVLFDGQVWLCIATTSTGNQPNTSPSDWVEVTGGTLYMSLINLNINNNPANTPAAWASGTSYSTGNTVAGSDGVIYTSRVNSNLGNNPANGANPTDWTAGALVPWTTTFTQGGGNSQWLQVGGVAAPSGVGLTPLDIVYPLGCGPLELKQTKNVFRLPAGYLRVAPQRPKDGAVSWLGVPGNPGATDWTYEGNYLVTWDGSPIIFRFVADVVDVTTFDPMFCEALAAKIGMEVCEPLTQSREKIVAIQGEYSKFLGEAVIVNGIETGAVEPPLDDLIACRV